MAIIIPSKNIYEKQNPKIRNNVIDKINAKTSLLELKSNYDLAVNSFESNDIYSDFEQDTIAQNYKITNFDIGSSIDFVASILRPKYKDYTLTFDRISSDRKIQKINSERLSVSVFGTKRIGNAKVTIQTNPTENVDWHIVEIWGKQDTQVFSNEYLYFPELKVSTDFEGFETIVAEEESKQKIDNFIVGEKSFEALCNALIGLETYSFYGKSAIGLDGETQLPTAYIDGIYEIYEPQKVEIQIFGDYINLENTEQQRVYGTGQNLFTIENNELLQRSSNYKKNSNEISISRKLGEATIDQYLNGKETCELLCSISEYYDENGNLVISTKNNELPMMFEKGDVAIPMTFSPQGEDIPISRNKEFKVVGVEPIYDGAVWQRLTLQEI